MLIFYGTTYLKTLSYVNSAGFYTKLLPGFRTLVFNYDTSYYEPVFVQKFMSMNFGKINLVPSALFLSTN
jgi:hypothetical protein